jgi:hypothetical protein
LSRNTVHVRVSRKEEDHICLSRNTGCVCVSVVHLCESVCVRACVVMCARICRVCGTRAYVLLHYYVFAPEWTTCYWVCTSLDQYQYNYPYGQPAEQTCSLDSVERADAVKMANICDVNRPNGNNLTPHSLGFPQVEQPFPLAA